MISHLLCHICLKHTHFCVTCWLQREVNQLRAQAPRSQFCSVSGLRFMLHSSSSSTSPRLFTHTTSLLRWPTPQGTEHWETEGGRERGEGKQRGKCCAFLLQTFWHYLLLCRVRFCSQKKNMCSSYRIWCIVIDLTVQNVSKIFCNTEMLFTCHIFISW